MSLLPRLNDTFPTTPLTDPLYLFSGSWTYNSGQTRLESTAAAVYFEVLNSTNPYGIFETNMTVNATNGEQGSNKGYIRAFGYYFVFARGHTYIIDDQEFSWHGHSADNSTIFGTNSIAPLRHPYWHIDGNVHGSQRAFKFVSTQTGLEFYIDGGLQIVLPHKSNIHNIRIGQGQTESSALYIHDILIKADSSVPLAPTFLAPGEAGSINAAQEVYVTVPDSRIYVDLTSYAPGITALSNVFYDPGGANVAMSPDDGIPTRSGGTTGDYYLEIPSNGVAFGYRMTIKSEFVIANSVVLTDTIDFDVDGGPSGQTGTVVEEDDMQCYFSMSRESPLGHGEVALNNLAKVPQVHNVNADGNQNNIIGASVMSLFDHSGGTFLVYNASVLFPIILDFDLGREYDIRRLNLLPIISGNSITGWDLYSNTVPFSGASLGQGTLEFTNYPVYQISSPSSKVSPYQIAVHPTLNFSTRYLRMVVPNSTYFNAAITTENYIGYELAIYVLDYMSLNSIDDNAQFEFDSGGGFGAFPGAGVSRNGGNVKITLPSQFQLADGERRFIAAQYRADLTD